MTAVTVTGPLQKKKICLVGRFGGLLNFGVFFLNGRILTIMNLNFKMLASNKNS